MIVKQFSKQDLCDIVNGAALLGCGGGGDTTAAEKILDEIFKISETVKYIDTTDVYSESDMAAVFAVMGSPLRLQKYCMADACQRSYELLKAQKKAEFIYPVSIETGAVNSLIPILISAKNKIPFINGDGGGRAFPKLTMCTFAGYKVNPSPAVLVTSREINKGGCSTILDAGNCYDKKASCVESIEDMARSIVCSNQFDGIGALGIFSMGFDKMQNSIVRETYTKCLNVGKTIRENQDDPVAKVVQKFDGSFLCRGRVTKVDQTTAGGFDYGAVYIKSFYCDEIITVLSINENFLVWSNKKAYPIAMAPDLICYITPEGQALSNVDIKEGMNICLVGFKADANMRLNKDILGYYEGVCTHLGYHGIYTPIPELEKINESHQVVF